MGVSRGSLSDGLTLVTVLLFSEGEADRCDAGDVLHVIQKVGLVTKVGCIAEVEGNVSELKGLGSKLTGFASAWRTKEFTGAHEKEEAEDSQVEEMGVDFIFRLMAKVKVFRHGSDESEADGAGSRRWPVSLFEAAKEVC